MTSVSIIVLGMFSGATCIHYKEDRRSSTFWLSALALSSGKLMGWGVRPWLRAHRECLKLLNTLYLPRRKPRVVILPPPTPTPPSTSPFSPNPSPRQSVYITACLDTVFVTNEERAMCIDQNQFRPHTCVPPIRAVGTLIPSDNRAVTPHLTLPLGSP